MNKGDNFEWDVAEGEDGSIILFITHENGTTERIPIRGLPDARSERMEMIYRTAQSVVVQRKHGRPIVYSKLPAADQTVKADDQMAKAKVSEGQTMAPPRFAAHCISFLAPKDTAQAVLGDMQEMFQKNVKRFGETDARRMYWMQVRASAGKWILDWLVRIGFFTAIANYFRSKFGL